MQTLRAVGMPAPPSRAAPAGVCPFDLHGQPAAHPSAGCSEREVVDCLLASSPWRVTENLEGAERGQLFPREGLAEAGAQQTLAAERVSEGTRCIPELETACWGLICDCLGPCATAGCTLASVFPAL